jgi:hypothetical protein
MFGGFSASSSDPWTAAPTFQSTQDAPVILPKVTQAKPKLETSAYEELDPGFGLTDFGQRIQVEEPEKKKKRKLNKIRNIIFYSICVVLIVLYAA